MGQFVLLLLFMLAIVIFGNIWFYFVDGFLSKIKTPFLRAKTPQTWHPLREEKNEEQEKTDAGKS